MKQAYWYLVVAALTISPSHASHHEIFVGEFEGMFVPAVGSEGHVRDLSVRNKAIDGGLNISWTATVLSNGELSTRDYSIDFIETEREHIYKAAQKKNLFGGLDPLDPMKGEPYAWARIVDRKLSIYMLLVTDDGGYEIHTYDRILTEDDNLKTQFSRIRNGELLRTLTATLNRTDRPSVFGAEKNK